MWLLLVACANQKVAPEGCVHDYDPCVAGDQEGVCVMGLCEALPLGPAVGVSFPLPDTSLRTCMGSTSLGNAGAIPCPSEASSASCADTPGCGQDAQYGWDVAHSAEDRFVVGGTEEATVQDSVTGLEWQRCALGQQGGDCSGDATLMDGFAALDACTDSTWGGHQDWTLPSAPAFMSIVDYGRTGPAFDESVFPNSPGNFPEVYDNWWIDCEWTSTDYAGAQDVAWVVMSNSGDLSQGSGLEYHHNDRAAEGWDGCTARCVRGEPVVGHGRFLQLEPVAEEAVVVDVVGRRMWTGCSLGQTGSTCTGDALQVDWLSALSACEDLTWAGLADWRLPDVKELRSLVDESRVSPAIDVDLFPNTPYYGPSTTPNVGNYWSSTARDYNDFALYVDFGTGFSHFYVQEEARHVRCVR